MAEKIIVKIIVDGEEMSDITMGEPKQDIFHSDGMQINYFGHIFDKEQKTAPYHATISLYRLKRKGNND